MEILTENEKQRMITEKWSISDKVDDAVELIYRKIQQTRTSSNIHKLDKDVWVYENEIPMNIFEMDFKLHYYIYSCKNSRACDFVYNNAGKMNCYIENEKELILTLYEVLGEKIKEYNDKNVVHEVEHMLQIHYGMNNNPNYKKLMSDAYDFASSVIYNADRHSKQEYLIANLIYYSNSHEQDAFVNEFYRDIKNNFGKYLTNSTECDIILNNFKEYVNIFFKNIDSDLELQKALSEYKQFGYNQNNFSIMIKKQLHRFEKKMNNVRKHIKHLSMLERTERIHWIEI